MYSVVHRGLDVDVADCLFFCAALSLQYLHLHLCAQNQVSVVRPMQQVERSMAVALQLSRHLLDNVAQFFS